VVERRAVFRLRICVARAERFDQVALDLRRLRRVLLGELELFPRDLSGGGGTSGKLMCGPCASAIAQCAIAHSGSSLAASWKDRSAALWLNP
jgi:hypothetical protein